MKGIPHGVKVDPYGAKTAPFGLKMDPYGAKPALFGFKMDPIARGGGGQGTPSPPFSPPKCLLGVEVVPCGVKEVPYGLKMGPYGVKGPHMG